MSSPDVIGIGRTSPGALWKGLLERYRVECAKILPAGRSATESETTWMKSLIADSAQPASPHRTGKLQGMLPLHESMVVRLSDVLAPHLGRVKDKAARVAKCDLHHKDELKNLPAGFRQFAPEYMVKGVWVELLKGN